MKIKDLTGLKFNRLTVVHLVGTDARGKAEWECRCDCGKTKVTNATNLKTGNTKSCGCLHSELSSARRKRHGLSSTRTYHVWRNMKARCNYPKHNRYYCYGGRGIRVCERWESFDNFLADMGKCPDGMSIDRINNDGDYEPHNCRWATNEEQSYNKCNTVRVEYNGQLMTVPQLAKAIGSDKRAAWARATGKLPLDLKVRPWGRGKRKPAIIQQ